MGTNSQRSAHHLHKSRWAQILKLQPIAYTKGDGDFFGKVCPLPMQNGYRADFSEFLQVPFGLSIVAMGVTSQNKVSVLSIQNGYHDDC